jgi:MFS family permease
MKKIFSSDAFAVLKVENFRFFLAFRSFMTMATLMQSIVVGWQIYSLTKNVLALGIIGLTEVIPQVSIALFAGHFVDLWDRKKIISYTSFILMFGSLLLLMYSIPSFNCYKHFGTFPIYIAIFLTGLTRGIMMPANTALLGQLVSRELYANAATWNSANWQIAAVMGPALGGLIYGFFGIISAYFTVFSFYLIAFLLLINVKSTSKFVIAENVENIFIRIREGIGYVYNNKLLLGAFSLDMFAVFFGGAVAMLPVFASDILKVGPEGLGLLRASPAVGAIIMSVLLMFYPPVRKTGKLLFICVAGFGICMIAFALSKIFFLSVIILVLSGAFDSVSVIIRATILQLFTPDEIRGRVAAVNSIFIGSSNEFGAFESGLAARIMGLIPSVIFGGSVTLLVVSVTSIVSPALRKLSLKKGGNIMNQEKS